MHAHGLSFGGYARSLDLENQSKSVATHENSSLRYFLA